MRHYRSLDDVHLEDIRLTIGSFDGVHRGHQSIIRGLTAGAQAEGVPAVVLTFFPHPAAILSGRNLPFYLSTPDEKAAIFKSLGVDVLITHPFNRLVANKTARQFFQDIRGHFNIKHLQVGYDFSMGKDREGDFPTLLKLGDEFGFEVKQYPPIEDAGGPISSRRIRFLLGVGQVQEAAALMGRYYQIDGMVEVGDQRGRGLGFPTANMAIWSEKVIPTAGVYASWVALRGNTWGAVTNVGVRPTFESTPVPPRVETHLLDFNDEIYGESIQLSFVARLRDERRFPSVGDLVAQIEQDTTQARKILFA